MQSHSQGSLRASEQEQRRLAQENAAIAEIGRIISSSLDINEVYERFVSEMRRLIEFDLMSVRLIDHQDQSFVIAYTSGIDIPERRVGMRQPLAGTLTEQALAAGKPILFEDQRSSVRIGSPSRAQIGLQSTMLALLVARDEVIGSLTVSSRQAGAYGEEELRLMEFLANQLAPAIENAQLYQKALDAEAEQRRLAQESSIIAEIGRIISSSLDINEVYERFAVELKKLVSLDRIVISTVNLDAKEFTVTYHFGLQVFERSTGDTHSLPGTHLEEAIKGLGTRIWEYTESSAEAGDVARFKAGLRSGITVPLIVHGNAIGTMSVQSCMPGSYGEREKTVLEWLANYIAPAIQNAQLYEQTLQSEEKQRQLARETSTISEIGRIISSSLDINDVYQRFAVELRKLVVFDRITISIANQGASEFTIAYHYGVRVSQRSLGDVLQGGHVAEVVTNRRSIIRAYGEGSTEPGDVSRFKAGLRSGVTVPLMIRSEVIGIMSVQSYVPDAYGEREKTILEWLAIYIAPAIQNAQLYEKTLLSEENQRRLAQETSSIAEVGRVISSSLNIDEVYGRFAVELKKLVEFDRIAINAVDWEKEEFTVTYLYGPPIKERELGVPVPLRGSASERVVASRKSFLIQYSSDSTDPVDVARFQAGLRSAVAVPLITRSKSVGAMSVQSRNAHAYGEREKVILEKLANLVAPAIDNAILYDESRRMGEELQQRANALARSNAELEQFAYVASHDLQEPLRSISGFTQLLARHAQDNLDDEANRLMNRITGATQRMQGLINDLLAYSRVGRNVDHFEGVDSESVLSEAVLSLEAAIQDADASITHDPLPVVPADPSLMGQVLQNLIGNSIKFQGDEPPHIHLSARETEQEWLFSVKDNGIGISPQFNERVFAIFQRLHTRDQYPGSGIGLAICRKAVERMGGRIWVESQPGQGSTFFFTVPKAAKTVATAIPSTAGTGQDISA